MTDYLSHQFSRDRMDDLLALVTHNAGIRWPHVSYLLNSDVAWRLPGSAPKQNIRLWYDDAGIAAYAWFAPNSPMTFDVRPDLGFDHPICEEIIAWCEQRALAFPGFEPWLIGLTSMVEWEQALTENRAAQRSAYHFVQVTALDTDSERIAFLDRHGFDATEHFAWSLTRSLDIPIPPVKLPQGMRLRQVEPADFPERVAVHRDAWFKSSFDMVSYLRVRAVSEFTPALDIVVEDSVAQQSSGTFASYCIGWIDAALGVGSFEPVGTRPAYRQMGLGQQVNYEGLRRMKAMGMHSAKIGTAGFNDRAFGLYTSCGFELIDKERTWLKRVG